MIETALMLPILLLFMLGVIEYGVYFFKEQTVQRTASTTAYAIQQNLGMSAGSIAIRDAAYNSGFGVVSYGSGSDGYVCANAYVTKEAAESGDCKGSWYIIPPYSKNPSGLDYVPGDPVYYVKVVAHAKYRSITSMFGDYIPSGITASAVVAVGAQTQLATRIWRSYPPGGGRETYRFYRNTTGSDAIVSISMRLSDNGCLLYIGTDCSDYPAGAGTSTCALVANCSDPKGSICMVAGTVPPGNEYFVRDARTGCGYTNWAELSTAPLD